MDLSEIKEHLHLIATAPRSIAGILLHAGTFARITIESNAKKIKGPPPGNLPIFGTPVCTLPDMPADEGIVFYDSDVMRRFVEQAINFGYNNALVTLAMAGDASKVKRFKGFIEGSP